MRTRAQWSRIKSGTALFFAFPFLTLALFFIIYPIPLLGNLLGLAAYFTAPLMLVLSATGNLHSTPPNQVSLALWAHYPLAGLVIGYFWPVQLAFDRACLTAIMKRYGLFFLAMFAIGGAIAIYALAHDS